MERKVKIKAEDSKRRYIGAINGSVDAWIDVTIDFPEEVGGIYWNKHEPLGLRLYIGKRKVTWQYFSQRRDHGERAHTFKTLGRYDRGSRFTAVASGGYVAPALPQETKRTPPTVHSYGGPHPDLHRAPWHVDYKAACDAATVERAGVITGTPSVNPGAGPTFAQAFDGGYEIIEGRKRVKIEGYLQYLERQAQEAGKPPRWADKVGSLGRVYMIPKWGKYRLVEMSDAPNAVAEWCAGIKSATSANHIQPDHACDVEARRQA